MRVALIDYRAGNLTSVRKALVASGADVFTPGSPDETFGADAVVVPGVGHFEATRVLDAPWRDALALVLARGSPLLGICLGLQWLFEGSDEAPGLPGLGLIGGRCVVLAGGAAARGEAAPRSDEVAPPGRQDIVKVPHVGWNALEIVRPSALLEGVETGAQAYFTHSYAAPITEAAVALTTHGTPFASVVERGRVFGVQFHPEKSGRVGLRVLANFLRRAG